MKVPDIMEKVIEKMKEMSGLNDIPVSGVTMGVGVNVELDDDQYHELIDMLNSMGYSFFNVGEDPKGTVIDVYYNRRTGEFISINYTKGEKYMVKFIIYYFDSYEVHT
jgi:hypothetical protein